MFSGVPNGPLRLSPPQVHAAVHNSGAIQHIFETVTISPNEKDVFVKQALLEQLFSYMCDLNYALRGAPGCT